MDADGTGGGGVQPRHGDGCRPATLEPKGRSQQFLPVRARLHPMLEVKIENYFLSYSATTQIDIIIIIDSALRAENEADLLVNEAAAVRGETEAPGTPYTEGVMQRRDTQTPAGTKLGNRSHVHRIACEAASDLQGKNPPQKNRSRMHLPGPAARCCVPLSAAGPDNDRMAARNVSRQGRQTDRQRHALPLSNTLAVLAAI